MSGSDLVRLAWLDDFIPPFRNLLDRHELADPIDEKESDKKWIVVSGDGLYKGFVGVETGFSIDYAGAEMGSLSIQTRGPSKLDLQCTYCQCQMLKTKKLKIFLQTRKVVKPK